MRRSAFGVLVLFALCVVSVPSAHADSVVLTFSGLQDLQAIGNYYNGSATNPQYNYGISFSSNVFALKSIFDGGSGGFSIDPSNSPAMFIMGSGPTVTGVMNISNGFSGGLSFFYTSISQQTLTVWSGANGTGTILAVMNLSADDGPSCGFPAYCVWQGEPLTFSGTAKSITFTGAPNSIGITDIVLGRTSLVTPEPSTLVLLGTGLLGTSLGGGWRFLRRRLRGRKNTAA